MALAGAVLQTVLVVVLLIVWRMTGSAAALAGLWLPLGGLALWAMTAVLFYTRWLSMREARELEEISQRNEADAALFAAREELELRPAARRARLMDVWGVRGFTLLFAVYHGLLAIYMIRWVAGHSGVAALDNTAPGAIFMIISAFTAFLFSRYCTGMASQSQWRLLRSSGGYLLVTSLYFAALFLVMLLASQGKMQIEHYVRWVLPIIQLVYAVELALNLILDVYRPKMPGDEERPAYESRLFGLVAEPGRVGHSIADTLNYQFGFEVSSTWFYQLLSKALLPLLLFGVAVLLLLSSVVIVQEGEAVVVKRWGRVPIGHQALGPGTHWKLPWPVSTTERFLTGQEQEIWLGVGGEGQALKTKDGVDLMLWKEEHGYGGRREEDFLIGAPPRELDQPAAGRDGGKGKPPAVSIIKLVVVIRYQVDDPYKYGYKVADAKMLIEDVASQEMTRYIASATLEGERKDAKGPQSIMTHGRDAAAKNLQQRIAKRLGEDGMDLGITVTFAGILSAHPPADAVPKFEEVLMTERMQDQQRYQAEAEAARVLAEVAGDPDDAMNLFLALRKAEVFERLVDQVGNATAFATSIHEYTAQVREQIKALEMEIHRERLLGRTDDDLRAQINLKQRYEEFIQELNRAGTQGEAFAYDEHVAAATDKAEELFGRLQGEPAQLVAEARAYRSRRELQARTAANVYSRKLRTFLASPRTYLFDQYMEVLDETLPDMTKYVLGINRDKVEIRLNLEEQAGFMEGSLINAEQLTD